MIKCRRDFQSALIMRECCQETSLFDGQALALFHLVAAQLHDGAEYVLIRVHKLITAYWKSTVQLTGYRFSCTLVY